MPELLELLDVPQQTIENEFRIAVLERLLDLLVARTGARISVEELGCIRLEEIKKLQAKYPDVHVRLEGGRE